MDLKRYDELRKKIQTKDFEGKNKNLDNWLYKLSFLGNIGSIFFAYFLVSPALKKAISYNLIDTNFGIVLSVLITIIILISFETVKRLLIKNLSFDLVKNKLKILKPSIIGWFIFSISIISLSFYLSLNGARSFASTSFEKNIEIENEIESKKDSIREIYESRKSVYFEENNNLRKNNSELRDELSKPNYRFRTRDQNIIIENNEIIKLNTERIDELDQEMKSEFKSLEKSYNILKEENKSNDFNDIILFLLISTSIEILIIIGVYFREYYEYNLYNTNTNRLEKLYKKRDRYLALLEYIYKEGKLGYGDKVMAASKLTEIIEDNTTIPNPKKFIEGFLKDMDRLDILIVQGKRRIINMNYNEAINLVSNFDDTIKMIEKLK